MLAAKFFSSSYDEDHEDQTKSPTQILNLFPQPKPNKITNHKQNQKSPTQHKHNVGWQAGSAEGVGRRVGLAESQHKHKHKPNTNQRQT